MLTEANKHILFSLMCFIGRSSWRCMTGTETGGNEHTHTHTRVYCICLCFKVYIHDYVSCGGIHALTFIFHPSRLCLLYPNKLFVMLFFHLFFTSHDFIGEFTTSFKELCRGENQLNVYEVSADKNSDLQISRSLCKTNKYWGSFLVLSYSKAEFGSQC